MKTNKLEKLRACQDAVEWVKTQKSPKDAWMNCERVDWMLWLAKMLNVDNRKLTLAKATCAEQVKHLMNDQRSLDALEACFRYAKGEITREELNVAASAASAVYASSASADAAYASAAAASAASAAYAAYAAAAASSASYAAANAKMDSLKKSADICREILTKEVLLKYKQLKTI